MAHSLRRPFLSPFGSHPFSRIQQRSLHITSPRCAVPRAPQAQQPRGASQPSIRVLAKEQGQIPTDLGLMPDTFIRPTGPNHPSLLQTPRDFFRLEYAYLRRSVINLFGLLVYKIMSKKPRVKLRFSQIAAAAVGLQHQMYSALAEGDVRTLRRICADGIFENCENRIRARGRETWAWELVREEGRPRVVSHRAGTMGRDEMGIRQAVVRIRSRQRLTRYREGRVVPGSGREKEVHEYVVIQKRMVGGYEGDWEVWGTTEETTVEKMDELAEMKRAELE